MNGLAENRTRNPVAAGAGAIRAIMPGAIVRVLAAPGDEVQIRGTGGSLHWDNECGEFWNESAREFPLSFDGEPAGSIACYAHTCLVTLTVPADAAPGRHTLAVEGGSSLELEVLSP